MKLFLSQTSNILSKNPQDKLSKLIEVFANYIRAPQRQIVNICVVSAADQKVLKINQVPLLVKSSGEDKEEPTSCSNPISIMIEIAKACYLDEILFSTANSLERSEILSFIELAQRTESEELVSYINTHLQMRMFLVGLNITAADIIVFLYVAEYFKELIDFQKIELCNAFRWIDHIQNLPGLGEQIESLGLFVSFPDESNSQPSKAQLKKLEKLQYNKQKKAEQKPAEEAKVQSKETGKDQSKQTPKEGEGEKKKQQQQQKPKQQPAAAQKSDENLHELSKIDFRVGKIIWVEKNPNSENLYNEKVDIGNGEIRTVASGLQKHLSLEQMQDKLVVIITNLKPRTLAGWESHGMVLVTESQDNQTLELLVPPEGSQPGDLIFFDGYPRKPLEQLPAKKSPWELVGPKLFTKNNECCYKNDDGQFIQFKTEKGVVKSNLVKDGIIK